MLPWFFPLGFQGNRFHRTYFLKFFPGSAKRKTGKQKLQWKVAMGSPSRVLFQVTLVFSHGMSVGDLLSRKAGRLFFFVSS